MKMIRMIKRNEKKLKENLKHLQIQRGKANKKRKGEWQKKIDKHFGF
jgi:hypothetical protein